MELDDKATENDSDPIRNANTDGGRIIQGIGITEWNDGECLLGPPDPYSALSFDNNLYSERHYRSMLVHFERNGEVLYDVWPEKGGTDIKSISTAKTSIDNTLYDLKGSKLQQTPQKRVYIQNGKKYIIK